MSRTPRIFCMYPKAIFMSMRSTPTNSTRTDPQPTFPARRILRVAPIDGFTAGRTLVTVEDKAAITTDQFERVVWLGHDMNGSADQAERCHLRLVSNAVSLMTVVVVQFPGRFPVKYFHLAPPCFNTRIDATLLPDFNFPCRLCFQQVINCCSVVV